MEKPGSTSIYRGRRPSWRKRSPNRLLKVALWMVWLPIIAVGWVILLDTSYDWISSPSNAKVISGLLILLLMVTVIVAVVVKGARKLWVR
jgi:uncharacterized membrane protein